LVELLFLFKTLAFAFLKKQINLYLKALLLKRQFI